MFKKIIKNLTDAFQGIKDGLKSGKGDDAWQKNPAPAPQAVPPGKIEPALEAVPAGVSMEQSANELREKIISNGFSGESCSSTSKSMKIVEPEIGNDSEFLCEHEDDEFTDQGIKTKKVDVFLKTAEENFISPAELHHAGICTVCRKMTDRAHLSQCSACRRNICSICTRIIEDKKFCREHYEITMYNMDSWKI